MQKTTFISKSPLGKTIILNTPNQKLKTSRKIVVKSVHYTPLTRLYSFLLQSIKKLFNIICCLKICLAPFFNLFKSSCFKSEKTSSRDSKILKSQDSRKIKKFVNIITMVMLLKRAINTLIDKSSFRTPKRLHTQDFAFIADKTYHQKEISRTKQSYFISKKLSLVKHLIPKVWRFSRKLHSKFRIFEGNLIFVLFQTFKCKTRFFEKNPS